MYVYNTHLLLQDLCPTVFSLLQDGTQDRSVCTVTSIQGRI